MVNSWVEAERVEISILEEQEKLGVKRRENKTNNGNDLRQRKAIMFILDPHEQLGGSRSALFLLLSKCTQSVKKSKVWNSVKYIFIALYKTYVRSPLIELLF